MGAARPLSQLQKNYQPAVRVMAPFSLRCDRMPNDACNAVSRSLGLVVVKRPPSRMRDSAGSAMTILGSR